MKTFLLWPLVQLRTLITFLAIQLWKVKVYALLIIMAFISYKMFVANYELQSPVISKRTETYTQVWNERAACLQDLDAKRQAMLDANQDILQ